MGHIHPGAIEYAAAPAPQLSIFIVEDERLVARDLAETLRELGYQVAGTAASAAEALRKASATRPDLVLMDVNLAGETDGVELSRRFKELYRTPVVYLTGNPDVIALRRALGGEPDGYLMKPVDRRQLRSAIEVARRRDELRRALEEAHDALARQKAELERRNGELSLLVELGDAIGGCATEGEVAAALRALAPRLFGGAAGSLELVGRDAARWDWDGAVGGGRFEEAIITEQVPNGTLSVAAAGGARRELVAVVAQRLGLVVGNLRLRERLRQESVIDVLTGLHNRRYMEEALERELRRAVRSHADLSVVIIDLDDFKLVNDRHGHAAGDAVLRAVGDLVRARVRASDVATRFGGDELVLILPDTGLEGAKALAEDLLTAMGRLEIEHDGQRLPPVRASMGVATHPAHAADVSSLMRAADLAVYSAKAAGRGRVWVAA
jgi:diguanylate cyclase (GGDEF)-like protein